MRKPDELALLELLKSGMKRPYNTLGVAFVYGCAAAVGMHENRLHYILEKWADRGIWEYGMSARTGWFTPDAFDDKGQEGL